MLLTSGSQYATGRLHVHVSGREVPGLPETFDLEVGARGPGLRLEASRAEKTSAPPAPETSDARPETSDPRYRSVILKSATR
jgi:hypothetical protein